MKKYIYNLLLLSGSIFFFPACSDFLDESPYSEVTNENYGGGSKDSSAVYNTGAQMESILTSAYAKYADELWQLDIYVMNEAQTDNAYGENNMQTTLLSQWDLSSLSDYVSRDWKYIYEQISKVNVIIHWVPLITKDPSFTETRKKEIDAEARFIRAHAYFNLVRIYENVPLMTQYIPEINLSNIDEIYPLLYPAQSTKEEIYTQIIEDLEIAEKGVKDYDQKKFVITKALVRLMQAEVYATKDGFSGTDWKKVKEFVEPVVADTRYDLLDNYGDLFAVATNPANGTLPAQPLLNENSKESIFEVSYDSWSTLGNWSAQMFYGYDWKKFDIPTIDLVGAFDKAGDKIRKENSIIFEDVTGVWTDKNWPTTNYPFCFKMRGQESANIILFRLPEAILLLAEAENELGNIGRAKELLNKVRNRVDLPNTTAANKDEMRAAIGLDHRLEFAFEAKRWFFLKRRDEFIKTMKTTTDSKRNYSSNLNEKKLIWPIPQSELDLNENLKQNPGY